MSIGHYFLRCQDKRPPKENQNLTKRSRLEATASVLDQRRKSNNSYKLTRVIDEKLGPLSQTLQAHAQQLKKIEERTTEAENRIAATEHTCETVDTRKTRRGVTQQSFSRAGYPTCSELETKAGHVKIKRAHRTLAAKPGPNQRPFLIRFHNFIDKQRVLYAARCSGTVKYKESTIMFFQDLSAAVLCKRKGLDEVKKRLRDTGAKYMMLYPATLKIIHGGEARSFDFPTKAVAFVDTLR
ncbi:hypothetical protein D5F01_LYC15243 [Larimichthys crocea]|uniref:LINE-1 type transposase domain-containing protein 1 n=1 Tax=Larimichthys crocea TaxID=215358 RepID=A0A6G0I7L2_LARCR|nr:hypothetical protein D5F01_LYC15243 [Larimichthys crocea]